MEQTISSVGGGRIGWINATWPFATLTATSKTLTLKVWLLGTYTFTPEQVVSLVRYGLIPFFGGGIKVNHNVPKYPEKIVFWCLSNPDSLIKQIREIGFQPAPVPFSPPQKHQGFPFRWQTLVMVIIIWNVLLYLDLGHKGLNPEPGPLSLLAVLMVFLLCLGFRTATSIQQLFLKEGREPEEVMPLFKLLTIVSGLMLFVFTISFLIM